LPRQVPLKLAMGMMLTGRHITANEARALGVVNDVVPRSELMTVAEKWAAEILECAPLSVRATKQCAMDGFGLPLREAMSGRYPAVDELVASDDMLEGIVAFAQKRKPEWKAK